MSQTHILKNFVGASKLPVETGRTILTEIAEAVWTALSLTGEVARDRELLLELIEKLASRNRKATRRVAALVPYGDVAAADYLDLAALAWLDQASADQQIGISRAASVWTEVGRWRPAEESSTPAEVQADARPDVATSFGAESSPETFEEIRYIPLTPHPTGPHMSYTVALGRAHESPESPMGGAYLGPPMTGVGHSEFFPDAPSDTDESPEALDRSTVHLSTSDSPLADFSEVEHLSAPTVDVADGLSGEDIEADIQPPSANEYRVWFGTNRKPNKGGTGFTAERDGTVRYGHCDVYIPKSHKLGELGGSFIARLVNWTDDRLKLRRTCLLPKAAFWQLAKNQLASVAEKERHAVVFIHGYNVSFKEAALRAAQIGFDLGIEGLMAFFSWPSLGTMRGYLADGESIEASERAISDFLVDFAQKADASAVHVIAHSMGNRGLLGAVERIAQDAQQRSKTTFQNFILAAPDVDADTFKEFAIAYCQLATRTTLYVSQRDKAVSFSRWLHKYPRVGFAPPVSVFDGIDTVNVTNVDLTGLGHGYVSEARDVLNDIHSLIFHRLPPDERFSLKPVAIEGGQRYWTFEA